MRTGTEIKVNMLLLRHGKTISNDFGRYLGKKDEPLSEMGKIELLKEKELKKYAMPEYLFISPMLRCIQTADIFFPGKKPMLIPEWREIDFGSFEGKNYRELQSSPEYNAWIDSKGRSPFPQGESREAFTDRVMEGWNYVQSVFTKAEKTSVKICGIVHGGTIMALLSTLAGGEYFNYQVKNQKGYWLQFLCSQTQVKIQELKKIC